MTRNTILTILIIAFAAGCTGKSPNQQKNTSSPDSLSQTGHADDVSGTVSGHFILAGSNCAGFNFTGKTTVLWTNEIACDYPDTLAIRWLDNKTFMTKSTRRMNESCPPRVDIYKVISYDNKRLVLQSVWTGWNDLKDETLELDKQTE
jgi:hypothetical protein